MIRVSVDTTKSIVTVAYDDAKTNIEQMKTALSNGGYPVKSVLSHTDVTPDQAKHLMDSDSRLMIVDVREPDEFRADHISGAINYPWNSGVLKLEYGKLPANDAILVVCGSGKRSDLAAQFLVSAGFVNVYDMIGGMSGMDISVNSMNIGHIGNDLKLGISCVRYRGNQYRFVLNHATPSDSVIWQMDVAGFGQIRVPGTCLSVEDDLRLNLSAEYGGITYSFALDYMANPDAPTAWKMVFVLAD